MPSTRKQVIVRLAPEDEWLADAMEALALKNGRSANDEYVHAARRHVAQPPTVTVLVETPELAEVTPGPKKARGRPRKDATETKPKTRARKGA